MLANIQALRTTGSEFGSNERAFRGEHPAGPVIRLCRYFPALDIAAALQIWTPPFRSVGRSECGLHARAGLLCARCIELRTLAFKQSRLGELS